MLAFNQEVFDEIITGTTSTWYTPAAHNALLGSADALVILAQPTSVVAPSSLTAYLDSSSDNQHWIADSTALWTGQSLTEGVTILGNWTMRHAFGRIRITLTGAGAQCRLKIGVTGRNL